MIFIDAILVKVRDGQVANRPFYVVIGVTVDGERDILGLWAGDGGEGAKYWLAVLTEIKNRGVADVCIAVCDGLKGLPGGDHHRLAAGARPGLHHASRCATPSATPAASTGTQMAKDLRPVYTAPSEAAAAERFAEFAETWGSRYPADRADSGSAAWTEFVPFLDYDVEIRTGHLFDQRDREPQRPLPAGGQGPRALPDRAGRAQVPLPGHPIAGPDRPGPSTMGDALEASLERVRDHLRRAYRSVNHQLTRKLQFHRSSDSPPMSPPDEMVVTMKLLWPRLVTAAVVEFALSATTSSPLPLTGPEAWVAWSRPRSSGSTCRVP